MAFQAMFSVFTVNKKPSYRFLSVASSFIFGYGRNDLGRSLHSLPIRNGIVRQSIMISSIVFTRFKSSKRRVDPPTDFLPFPWKRGERFNIIENSGDHVRSLDVDPALPKEGLDVSEYLEGLDVNVRKQFTLESGSKTDRRRVAEELILKKVQQHPMDFHSKEVRIALKTLQVRALMEHYRSKLRVPRAKVILLENITKRNSLLRKLRNVDMPCFEWLIKELNIEFTPPPFIIFTSVRKTRKNELRRLTKEYSEKLISDKRTAYHAELKEQQQAFLKEKAEILAWIAEEERDLGISHSNSGTLPA